MRWLVVTTSLLAALWLGTAQSAWAQDPPPPPPPEQAPPPPPPPQARERNTAVPRAERVRETTERQQRITREPEPTRAAQPAPARDLPAEASAKAGASAKAEAQSQSSERAGSSRREVVRENAAREVRTGEESSRRRVPVNVPREPSTAAAASTTEDQATERRGAVRRPPTDSRGGSSSPRDRAVARTTPPPDRDRDRDRVYVVRDYWSYGRYYDPFYYDGFHLGYLAYSPWGWSPAFYGSPYAYGGHGYYQAHGYDIGRVRLKVKPQDAEVYVDGYFAGTIDDFDGVFQSLRLDSGGYRIEIRKPGFEPLHFDVRVQPDRTITYRGEMRPTP